MKTVLVVDDSETIRLEVGRALKEAGFSIAEAGDGIEGLGALKARDVSLVLLDINMPRMGGMEMLEQVKADPATKHVPVLLLTTEVQESMIQRARKAGAAGWIYKPPVMRLLVETVAKLAK